MPHEPPKRGKPAERPGKREELRKYPPEQLRAFLRAEKYRFIEEAGQVFRAYWDLRIKALNNQLMRKSSESISQRILEQKGDWEKMEGQWQKALRELKGKLGITKGKLMAQIEKRMIAAESAVLTGTLAPEELNRSNDEFLRKLKEKLLPQ
ncbi:MAG: hypothetical protein HY917_05620 [Candidatus Diapherotrites archaeon]|nr:hypothetical protein [Candidatus Diapherotrites archaeon]